MMTLKLDNWRVQFHLSIDTIRNHPFDWETANDCLFGLTVPTIKAMTGVELFGKYKRYKSAVGALKVMRNEGFANLADLVASELPEIKPSECVMGDVVAVPTDDGFGFSIGIANTDRCFVMLEFGLGTRDMSEVTRAFRV